MRSNQSRSVVSHVIKVTVLSALITSSFSSWATGTSAIEANDRPTPADIIVMNADIRTSDAAKPRASALAIKDGKF
ncbi:amidohydrolase, partial [Enterobacter hormaechei]|nr:amidohydrolase [Enterobacter hormaechei]